MSNPLSSIISTFPTNGVSGTSSTDSAGGISLLSSIFSSVTLISSETTLLPPLTSTTPTTIVPTLTSTSSLISTEEKTSSSTTTVPSTTPTFIQPTSTSVSSTETVSSDTVTGSHTTTLTLVQPTPFVNSQSSDDVESRRTAIIAGTTVGFIALVLIILGAVFVHRRRKLRKVLELSGKKREGRSLLDGEEFDDEERNNSSMLSYQDLRHPTLALHPAASSTPSLFFKPRTSETGSIFREEVWPPPGFIDPITKLSSQVDLSCIVDDVMGPTSYGTNAGSHEYRQPTDSSTVSAFSSTSSSPLITDPFANPGTPSTLAGTSTPPSPGTSSTASYPTVRLLPPSFKTWSGPPNTEPQKSSPLARFETGHAKLWLTRNIRPVP